MKFTKDEINLCKQIAEKHKKEIERGNWILDEHSEVRLTERIQGEIISVGDNDSIRFISQYNPNVTPIWTISDCLEFLEEKGLNLYLQFMCFPNGNWRFAAEDNKYEKVRGEGKTRLEACLKAVLAVLEGGNRIK